MSLNYVKKQEIVLLFLVALAGCSSISAPSAPELHNQLKGQINLGMSRGDFDVLMHPVQSATFDDWRRSDESFTRDSSVIDIVYIRTDWIRDDVETDDEYTPYVFRDGLLVAFGWRSIGGMKVTSRDIAKARSGATKIKVSQKTSVGSTAPKMCVPDLNGDGRCMGGKCC